MFNLLTYFVIYSLAGWILESVFRSICERKIINTGFLKGPFCPIYGVGAIIMIVFLDKFKENILLLFIMSIIILTIWEYIVGYFLEKAFNTKYWDYSDHKINFQGRICLTNSIFWGILGVIFIYYIHPFIEKELMFVNETVLQIVVYFITILLIIDAITSIIKVKNIHITLEKIENINKQIKEKIEEMKNTSIEEEKETLQENLDQIIENLNKKKNQILRRLYKRVYRLKKAFPAINSEEITQILNKKIEIIKKENNKKKNKIKSNNKKSKKTNKN